MSNSVWVGEDIDVVIFREIDGVPVGMANPLKFNAVTDLQYALIAPCFIEKVDIKISLEASRRPETGKQVKSIVQEAFEFTASMSNLYHNPIQFNDMLYFRSKSHHQNFGIAPAKTRLRLVFTYFTISRDWPYCSEQKILTGACVKDGGINFSNGANVIDNIEFWAERMISPELG